jgi:tRNA(Ile2) C34 agmatinyltransferase TiaS
MSDDKEKERKTARQFIKDGDDEYSAWKPRRMPSMTPMPQSTRCSCGGKLKAKGAFDACGTISWRCNKCGKRTFKKMYSGKDGLIKCY